MDFGKPTTLAVILDAVADRVAAALPLDRAYVFPSLDLGDWEGQGGPADLFCVLTSPAGRADQGDVEGGGNDLLTFDGSLSLELFNRLEVDDGYRDTAALQDATLGLLARWNRLLRRNVGLQMFAPLEAEADTQSVLAEPMRVLTFDLRPRLKSGWMKLVSRWELKWVQDQG